MSWNYAELSKLAKNAGGPEALMSQIKSASESVGRMQGRMDMIPVVGVGIGLGALLTKLYDYYKEKKDISLEEANKAEIELIEGIKKYDLSHSEENSLENDGESLNDELCIDNNNQQIEKVADDGKLQSEEDV